VVTAEVEVTAVDAVVLRTVADLNMVVEATATAVAMVGGKSIFHVLCNIHENPFMSHLPMHSLHLGSTIITTPMLSSLSPRKISSAR
jgi:hypothetical protein